MKRRFHVELIKPSHYDDDGYVIQWWKAWIPSNSLASLYGLAQDAAGRRVLGDDVEIVVSGYDECNQRLPIKRIIERLTRPGCSGLVCLVGVQTNQFPRAMDIAAAFAPTAIPVIIGGFHVSGCLAMLPEIPAPLQAAMEAGVSLFAGEAEGRLDEVLEDAHEGRLKPLYNYLSDLPQMQGEPAPALPATVMHGYSPPIGSFDAGRGCPFQCSFCTIINVQGRKSRYRSAADVERLVRAYLEMGISNYFITDDDFARNKNWEAIFDVLIRLREEEAPDLHFIIQVDTLAHRLPGFVEKASRAGCKRVFIGLESVNPENLLSAKKRQNRIAEYRTMLQAWREAGVFIYAGYILGFAADTPAAIRRDIRFIQDELPIDILELNILTPLPGSADHQQLHQAGTWMSPDMNDYDLEHVVTNHPTMSREEWQGIYHEASELYFTPEHTETLLRRAVANNLKARRLMFNILQFHGCMRYEKVHPLQGGFYRRKVRTSRRPGFALRSPLTFYPWRLWDLLSTYVPFLIYALKVERIFRRVQRDPAARSYTDLALSPSPPDDEGRILDLLQHPRPPTAASPERGVVEQAGREATG